MLVDDESQELESPEAVADDVAAPGLDQDAHPPRNPRQVRARRRRRRRQFGTLLFVVVAAGVFAAAYFALAGDDTSSKSGTSAAGSLVTTTVAPPFVAHYKATAGLNVRQRPGTNNVPIVGVVETGRDVTVVCVIEGEPVNTPSGPNSQWLGVAGPWPTGYVSSAFVAVGDDLTAKKIPACPAA
jgi:hypothetical protein